MKILLNKKLYKHFLLLHASCRILCSKENCLKYVSIAKDYLKPFFIALGNYYGLKSQVINSHHLIHLADDVRNMKCSLSEITAFPFESYLGKLKKYIRTASKPLSQLCRRLHEERLISSKKKVTIPPVTQILNEKPDEITSILFRQCTITNQAPNNVVLMNNNDILEIRKILRVNDILILVKVKKLQKKKPIFNYPFNSKLLKMWQLEAEVNEEEEVTDRLENVNCKLVKLGINFKEGKEIQHYVIPLLHQ